MSSLDKKHNTDNEKEFIDRLGTWYPHWLEEKNFYRSYLKALYKRNDWTGLDRQEIINYANKKWAESEIKSIEN